AHMNAPSTSPSRYVESIAANANTVCTWKFARTRNQRTSYAIDANPLAANTMIRTAVPPGEGASAGGGAHGVAAPMVGTDDGRSVAARSANAPASAALDA